MLTLLLVVFILAFSTITYADFTPPACEDDRSCCADILGDTDTLCFNNETYDFSTNYSVWRHWDNTTEERMQFHYHGSMFYCNSGKTFFGQKGGCSNYGAYGEIMRAIKYPGGNMFYGRWQPFRLQAFFQNFVPMEYAEMEMTGNKYHQVWRWAIECEDGDNCDIGVDAIQLQSTNVDTPILQTNIDGVYCGIRTNETLSSNSYAPSRTATFTIALDPCPHEMNITGNTVNYYYNATQNEVINVTVVYTAVADNGTTLYESDNATSLESSVSDWMTNYEGMLNSVASEYQNFSDSFIVPSALNSTNAEYYYNTFYSLWATTYGCPNENDPNCAFYFNNTNHEVLTPNIEQYYGLWVWDSFTQCLQTHSYINTTTSIEWVNNICREQLLVWQNVTHAYPIVDEWSQNVREFGNQSPSQPAEGWVLTTLQMYDKGLINSTFMCNDTYPHLRSHFDYRVSNRGTDWLVAQINGRDGTDALSPSGTGDNPDASGFLAISALGLKTMSSICNMSNATLNYYQSVYDNISNDFGDLWDNETGMFWARNDTNTGRYQHALDSGWNTSNYTSYAVSPMGNCMAIAAGLANQSQTLSIVKGLINNFTFYNTTEGFTTGLTSINTGHVCFTPGGKAVVGCNGGETWDGASWIGIDGFWCINSLIWARNNYNFTGLDYNISYLINLSIDVTQNSNTPFGAESYDSASGKVDSLFIWGAAPYAWGMNNVPTSNWNYTVFEHLDFSGNVSAPAADVTEPVITLITETGLTNVTITIGWTTDENANTTLDYGVTTALGNNSGNSTLDTSHSIPLTSLTVATLYYYNITSCDASSNCNTTGPFTFTTNANAVPATPTNTTSIDDTCETMGDQIGVIGMFLGIIIVAGFGVILMFMIKNYESIQINPQTALTIVVGFAISVITIIVAVLIIANTCAVT